MPIPEATANMIFAAGQTGLNVGGGLFGQGRQYRFNRKLAELQHSKNLELLKYQLDYNSPASQMARFKEAGLNPNLIYGQGDAGNWSQSLRYPDIQSVDMQSAMAGIGDQMARARLMNTQADLTQVKVDETGARKSLIDMQKKVLSRNPHLSPDYLGALVDMTVSNAQLKRQELYWMTDRGFGTPADNPDVVNSRGWKKMDAELSLLEQRYKLGAADQQIKAQVFESKEFQNDLLEIQKNWMKDGDITPQHLYAFLSMLMMKLIGR